MLKNFTLNKLLIMCAFVAAMSLATFAQTSSFSYQGRLSEAGNPVTGTRFFQFTLFDENGAAIPGATADQTLTVTNGVFNTTLDFGAANFPGANRSLQIAVKINVGDAYTILNPRQAISLVPYAIKSLSANNAASLSGVNAASFVQQDAGGNVSVSGGLTVNAQTQCNLGGQRILAANLSRTSLALGQNSGNTETGFFNTLSEFMPENRIRRAFPIRLSAMERELRTQSGNPIHISA